MKPSEKETINKKQNASNEENDITAPGISQPIEQEDHPSKNDIGEIIVENDEPLIGGQYGANESIEKKKADEEDLNEGINYESIFML
jgi:hypothetical protein